MSSLYWTRVTILRDLTLESNELVMNNIWTSKWMRILIVLRVICGRLFPYIWKDALLNRASIIWKNRIIHLDRSLLLFTTDIICIAESICIVFIWRARRCTLTWDKGLCSCHALMLPTRVFLAHYYYFQIYIPHGVITKCCKYFYNTHSRRCSSCWIRLGLTSDIQIVQNIYVTSGDTKSGT